MKRTLFVVTVATIIGAGYTASAFSQAKPDVQVKLRQSAMALTGKYFGPLGLMAAGKIPYDANVAARNAAFLDALTKMPWDNFTADTQAEKSRALPEVFKDTGKFKEAQDRLQGDVAKLVSATRGGNEANVKAAAADVGKACANCHDNFRAKQ
jgi:cytochrome c556